MSRELAKYQGRIRALHERAKLGNRKAMEELHKRYHINKMMINGKLVNLERRFAGPPHGG